MILTTSTPPPIIVEPRSIFSPATNTRAVFPLHDAISTRGAVLHIPYDPWAVPIFEERNIAQESSDFSLVFLAACGLQLEFRDVSDFSTMIVSGYPSLPDRGKMLASVIADIMEALEISTAKGLILQFLEESFILEGILGEYSIGVLGAYFMAQLQYKLGYADKRPAEALSIASKIIGLLKQRMSCSAIVDLYPLSFMKQAVEALVNTFFTHMSDSELSVSEAVAIVFDRPTVGGAVGLFIPGLTDVIEMAV